MTGIRNRRRAPWHAVLGRTAIATALLLALEAAVVSTAEAADLPAQLIAAAKAIPADAGGRRICLSINGLTNAFGMPPVLGDQLVSAGSTAYAAATVGAYLGDGPAGAPASPFAQALLDAGAAARLRVIWTQQTRVPALRTPQLQDLGTAASALGTAPQPAFVERDATSEGDVYLVTGPDPRAVCP